MSNATKSHAYFRVKEMKLLKRKLGQLTREKNSRRLTIMGIAALMAIAVPLTTMTQQASADKYDDQIQALQNEINQYQSQSGVLKKKIGSLQEELTGIENQKNVIQAQINIAQIKFDQLTVQIKDTETKITTNQDTLGRTIADLYVNNTTTPIEMLASSDNIADFVDKQAYRSSVQDQLAQSITRIKKLKERLDVQKADVQRTINDQKNAKSALAETEKQKSNLLAQAAGEKDNYDKLTSDREAKKLDIQQQQQEEIAAAIAAAARANGGAGSVVLGGTSGAYPWNDSNCFVDGNAWSHGGANGSGVDGAGYGCRQCVSYVAWRAAKETGYYPRYWGNANNFPANARASGIAVGTQPRAGSAGVITAGQYGHIVWVESVDASSGTMVVSQYNYWNAGGPGWGHYSKMQVPIGTYQAYIYF